MDKPENRNDKIVDFLAVKRDRWRLGSELEPNDFVYFAEQDLAELEYDLLGAYGFFQGEIIGPNFYILALLGLIEQMKFFMAELMKFVPPDGEEDGEE